MGRKLKKCLTLKEKAEIIDCLKKGASDSVIANKLGLVRSPITRIKKKEQNIRSALSLSYMGTSKKTLRTGEFPRTEKILYKWFLHQRKNNIPMSGDIIIKKARYFFNKIK